MDGGSKKITLKKMSVTLLKLLLSHHPILENKQHEIMPGQASIRNSTQLKKSSKGGYNNFR
jgi:hypothetical protein